MRFPQDPRAVLAVAWVLCLVPQAHGKDALDPLPLYFIENRGQADPRVGLYLQGKETSVFFESRGLTFVLTGRPSWVLKLDFVDASPGARPAGEGLTPAIVSYFKGDRDEWRTEVPTYHEVIYRALWPGIDLVYGGEKSRLKYTFEVGPGADPDRIRLSYRGASRVRVTEQGRLAVDTPAGGFEDDAPYAFQEIDGIRKEVDVSFLLEEESGGEAYSYGFRVGEYDRTRPLILDPVILAYTGYIGGSGDDFGNAVAVDGSGNVYVAGSTSSTEATFPETVGPDLTYNLGSFDVFVAKVDPTGASLVYCGYIGGSASDTGRAIAVDSSGNAYVAGSAASTETTFPETVGPDLTYNGATDAFVAKVSADGTTLVYAGYIGGSASDTARAIAVDASGSAYVVGETASTEATFPVNVGPDVTHNLGTNDAFVAKVDPTGASLTYSGYIGGSSGDSAWGVAVDGAGEAYVVGRTASSEATFPAVVGPDTTYNGGTDAFVAKVSSTGAALVYAGYIGGSVLEEGYGIAVDASGNAYIGGMTSSSDFPAVVGPDTSFGSNLDAFVAKVNATGSAVVYAGFIGGVGDEYALGIAVDGSGNAYVAGHTTTNETEFPVTSGPDLLFNGFRDAYVAKVNAAGTGFLYCGYIGGTGDDRAMAIAVDSTGSAYIAGFTASTEASFPEHVGPGLIYGGGANDAFVAKIEGAGGTAVRLTELTAKARNGGAILEWETASELDNLGFHVHQASSAEGAYERITSSLIPGLGSTPSGARYRYEVAGLENGETYFFHVEDVETSGATNLHGPVSVSPDAGSGVGSGAIERSLITYGTPGNSSFRILDRSQNHAVLELRTEGFHAEPQEDGSVVLSIPGFEPRSEANGPAIPVLSPWVDAVFGRRIAIASVRLESVERIEGLIPAGAGAAEIVSSRRGTIRLHPESGRRRKGWEPIAGGLYPPEAARSIGVGFQGDAKRVQIELAPVRWYETRREIHLARRMVVTLSFRGREVDEMAPGENRGRRRSRVDRAVVARLATRDEGLYAVVYEDVFPRGRRPIPGSALRLSRQGEPVAFHLDTWEFDRGSRLYFLSDGSRRNPYGEEAVYELEVASGGGRLMDVASAAPSGEETRGYRARVEREENHLYQAALLDAPDLWLWDALFAPARKTYALELTELEEAGEAPRLSVWLQGVSDSSASPDHHVRFYVNGVSLGESSWDGKQPQRVDLEVASAVLRNGENLIELENVRDTEAPYSMVMLDRFAVEYSRRSVAEEGRLVGSWTRTGTAALRGLGERAYVLDVTEEEPRWLSDTEKVAGGAVRLRVEAGRRYLATAQQAVLRPEVRAARPSRLRTSHRGADYLLIGPSEFVREAHPLVELRARSGLRVRAVSIEEIYDELGFGEARPEAIRDFLELAYHDWPGPPPRYALLLGDGTYDFKDYLGTGVENRVPPLPVKTSYLWTASDPMLAAVNGDDILPDLAIGRLPAASREELRAMVGKIVAYENAGENLAGPFVLVADDPDGAGDFVADAEEIASGPLAGMDVRKLYLGELGTAALRNLVREALDEGSSLLSYIGHGGIHLWADENVFHIDDVGSLRLQARQPLLVTMNCLNGYFHFPYFDSLSESMVKAEGKGAIAAFSPSGLSLDVPAHRLHGFLLHEIFDGGHERLGDAVLAAQEAYARSGAFPELLSIYHLFGDPALRIRR